MTIRSNPSGATVFVDDQQIGTTPVSTSFRYYGTRKIKLVKPGYETHTALHTFDVPWYQVPPLDFISENLIAREIRDERVVDFQLLPRRIVTTEELVSRASELRLSSRQGVFVPNAQSFAPQAVAPASGAIPVPLQ